MSDGIVLDAVTTPGDKVWCEDFADSRGKVERVKLVIGVLDTDGGDVASGNPLPITTASLPLPTGAAKDSTLASVLAAVTLSAHPLASSLGAASKVVKNSAGTLYSIFLRNRNAAVRYAMLFDSTTVPADGTVTPLYVFVLSPSSDRGIGVDSLTNQGISFTTGITIAISTTDGTTKTLATASDHDIGAIFQ